MVKVNTLIALHTLRTAPIYEEDIEPKPLSNFKDFDFKDYDVKNMKRADSMLKKAWSSIKKALNSTELRYAAGILLSVAIMTSKSPKLISVLKDIVSGRVGFDTLQNFKDALSDIAKQLSSKDGNTKLKPLPDTGITLRPRR